MDSPAFGSSNKNHKIFRATTPNHDHLRDIKYSQNTLIMLAVQKNIRKLISVLNSLQIKNKRMCFLQIKYKQPQIMLPTKQFNSNEIAAVLDVQRKLNSLQFCMQQGILRNKLSAWRQIVFCNILKHLNDQKKINLYHNERKQEIRATSQRGIKRAEDWKQNSTSNGLDLASQNKKLKNQINKQQMQEQSFINKMKALLDAHQKQKPKINNKKKK